MNLNNLPHVSATNFYHAFTRGGKQLFWILYGLTLIGVFALLYFNYHPHEWVVKVSTIAEVGKKIVPVQILEGNYRQVPLLAEAYYGFINFAAGPITVSPTLLILLCVFSAAGWSALMAAASRTEGVWPYSIYVALGFAIYTADAGSLFWGVDPYFLATLSILLVFWAPAALFRSRWLVWSVPAQTMVYAVIFCLYFVGAYLKSGLAGVHQLATHSMWVQGVMVILFLLFTAREVVNTVILICNNYNTPEKRRPLALIISIIALILIGELVWVLRDFGILPKGDWFLQPAFMLGLICIVSVATLQNVYHQVRSQISSQLTFSVLILGMGLTTLGTLIYAYGSAEYLVRVQTDRLIMLIQLILGGLYFIYILLHFGALLRKKVNVYFVLLEPPKPTPLRFIAVWFIGICALIYIEGSTHWRTRVLWWATHLNQQADTALLRGDNAKASEKYALALSYAPGDVKANYNLASVLISGTPAISQIAELYNRAEELAPFPLARINLANYLIAMRRPSLAYLTLKGDSRHLNDARVYCNLAAQFRRDNKADSAVYYLRQAILTDPTFGVALTNLGLVYLENDKPKEARAFFAASTEVAAHEEGVLGNAAFFNLTGSAGGPIPLQFAPSYLTDTTHEETTRINLALELLRSGKKQEAKEAARTMGKQKETGEIQLLNVLADVVTDSLESAISRFIYIKQYNVAQSALAAHALGALYLQEKTPEMAEPYFYFAAQQGLPQDSLNAAFMQAEAGNFEMAYKSLTQYRAFHMDEYKPIAREVATLLRANNRTEIAMLEWNFEDVTLYEGLRLGIFANRAGNLTTAVEAYVDLVRKDTTTTLPYLEMGKMYREINDSLALIQFDAGLPRNKNDFALRLEIARSKMHQKKTQESDAIIAALEKEKPNDFELRILLAEKLLLSQKTEESLKAYQKLHIEKPLDQRPILAIAEMFWQKKDFIGGNQFLTKALRLNERNSTLWSWNARFSNALSLEEETKFAIKQAERFTYTPDAQKTLKARLKAWELI